MNSIKKMTEQEKYDKAYNDFCDNKRITFSKTDLIEIWNAYIDDIWNGGFDSIFGYSFHNDFLVSVLIPRIRRNKKWLLENGGENIVMTIHFYKEEIKNLFK